MIARTDLRIDVYCARCGWLIARYERLDVQLERLRRGVDQLKEAIGTAMLPAFVQANAAFARFAAAFRKRP